MQIHIATEDGTMINKIIDARACIPAKGDTVRINEVLYDVSFVVWDYEAGCVDLMLTRQDSSALEKLHYDERTMGAVMSVISGAFFRAGFTKSGATSMTNEVITELQNVGILFRERASQEEVRLFPLGDPTSPAEDLLKGHNTD